MQLFWDQSDLAKKRQLFSPHTKQDKAAGSSVTTFCRTEAPSELPGHERKQRYGMIAHAANSICCPEACSGLGSNRCCQGTRAAFSKQLLPKHLEQLFLLRSAAKPLAQPRRDGQTGAEDARDASNCIRLSQVSGTASCSHL